MTSGVGVGVGVGNGVEEGGATVMGALVSGVSVGAVIVTSTGAAEGADSVAVGGVTWDEMPMQAVTIESAINNKDIPDIL